MDLKEAGWENVDLDLTWFRVETNYGGVVSKVMNFWYLKLRSNS
jgi:hypothetical protein